MQLTEKDFELLQESLQGALKLLLCTATGGLPPRAGETEAMSKAAKAKAAQRKQMTILLRAKIELARQALQAANIAKA